MFPDSGICLGLCKFILFLFSSFSCSFFFLKAHLSTDYLPGPSPADLQLTYSYLSSAFPAFCPDYFYNFMYPDSSKFKTQFPWILESPSDVRCQNNVKILTSEFQVSAKIKKVKGF